MSRLGQDLMAMYEALRARFGHQGWWPVARDLEARGRALEICVGAILTQNTAWSNVERALGNLRAAGAMSVGALAQMDRGALSGLIRPAGYFNVKAKRLKNFIAAVHRDWGEDIEAFLDRSAGTLREDLLSINGVGRETADSIVLYAAGKCTFVVDAYTARVCLRHRLIGPEDDYESIKDLFELSLPADVELYNDFHAQFVAVGKRYCRPRAKCEDCPLEHLPHDAQAGMEDY